MIQMLRLQEGSPHTRTLDISAVKRHAKRLSEWTDLTTSESQELTARVFGASSWQALTKWREFSSDEDLTATLGAYFEDRKNAQLSILRERLHICEALAETILGYWQPTAASPIPYTSQPIACRYNPFASQRLDCTVLHSFVPNTNIPIGFRLALVRSEGSEQSALTAGQSIDLVLVRQDRLALYISPDDFIKIDPHVHGRKTLANAWDRLQNEPNRKRLESFERVLARSGTLILSSDVAAQNIQATAVRVIARWLLEPLNTGVTNIAELANRFAKLHPWKREEFHGISKSKLSFYCVTHFGLRFEVKALDQICVVVYRDGSRYEDGWVQLGAGGIKFLKAEDERPFKVHKSGFYLVKYGNQSRGGPFSGFDEATASLVSYQLGIEGPLIPSRLYVGFHGSPAGLAFAKWIATESSPGHKHLKANGGDTHLGSWKSGALARMKWELIREKAL